MFRTFGTFFHLLCACAFLISFLLQPPGDFLQTGPGAHHAVLFSTSATHTSASGTTSTDTARRHHRDGPHTTTRATNAAPASPTHTHSRTGAGSEVKFHLASAPQKWLTLNGNDISGWLAGDEAGQPRALRPALPPAEGNDVRAVQKALAAAGMTAPQSGVYDGGTAATIAQFQKKNGLNADGVVNAATRQKLGVKPEPAKPDAAPKQPPARRSN